MWTDPIVEETRAIRDSIAAKFDYEPIELGEHFKSMRMTDLLARVMAAANSAPFRIDRHPFTAPTSNPREM